MQIEQAIVEPPVMIGSQALPKLNITAPWEGIQILIHDQESTVSSNFHKVFSLPDHHHRRPNQPVRNMAEAWGPHIALIPDHMTG